MPQLRVTAPGDPPFWFALVRRFAVAVIVTIDEFHPPRPAKPRPVSLSPLREEHMATRKVNVYECTLPPLPADTDVTERRVVVTEDGAAQPVVTKTPDDGPFELRVTQGAKFTVSLVDFDGTNESEPAVTEEMTASDQWAPPSPSAAVTLTALREETAADGGPAAPTT